MNLFFPHGNRVLQSPMHALAAEQSDAEAEERAGLRPWRMGAVGCMAAKAPGRARRKGSNGRDGLASCMATTRRKRKPHGQRRVAQCERFNCSCGKQSRSDVIPLLSFHMQTNGGCADVTWPHGDRKRNRDEARQRAELLRPILAELAGMTARAMARELNEREVPLPSRGPWHAMTVIRVQRRLKGAR